MIIPLPWILCGGCGGSDGGGGGGGGTVCSCQRH